MSYVPEYVSGEIIGRWTPQGITGIEVVEPGIAPNRRWCIEPAYDYYLVRVPRAQKKAPEQPPVEPELRPFFKKVSRRRLAS